MEAARRKELKATPMDGVKRIAQDLGVEAKNKSDLVEVGRVLGGGILGCR